MKEFRRSSRLVARSILTEDEKPGKSKYFINKNNNTKNLSESDACSNIKIKNESDIDIKKEPLETEINLSNDIVPLKKKRKTIKHENIKIEENIDDESITSVPSLPPPKNFQQIYDQVKFMRSKIIAPVDTMGCASIPTKISSLKEGPVFRYQLLVSLMLSSQTKDEINYEVMNLLHQTFLAKGFEKGLCIEAIREISEIELDKLIFKVGFHTRKAKYIKQTTEILHEKYADEIPKTIQEIMAFPGVGPKMGYLLLQSAWNITTGIGVDVHVFRLANMWGWVPKLKNPTPETTRLELEKWLPRDLWTEFNPILVGFGQSICLPRGRRCDLCTLPRFGNLCPNVDRKLLNKKISTENKNPKKTRGDLSGIMNIGDIEEL